MVKQLLIITLGALALTACGGSDSGGNNNSVSNPVNTEGESTNGQPSNDGPTAPVISGVAGDFGDTASAENGIGVTATLCPANAVASFSRFTQLADSSWCVKICEAGEEIGNPDGDEWGVFGDDLRVCRITTETPGTTIRIDNFSAPIAGCPDGCVDGFPAVFVSANASASELAGSYTCESWLFDQQTKDWGDALTNPAPFSLTLNADDSSSANYNGTATTWSFANGVLTFESGQTLSNVAVGTGSFTSYTTSTDIIRCKS